MASETTTLHAVYHDEPLPQFESELPILQHRIAEGDYDGRLAIYGEDEIEDLREQIQQQRENNGDHIKIAELEVTDWNVDPDTLKQLISA